MHPDPAPVVGDQLLAGLDEEQFAAATSEAERTTVIAGPGAGKTSVLAARIVWLCRLRGVPPEAIAAFTFTREAAAELRSRVAQTIGAEAAARMTCSTLHGFASRVLARVLADGYRIADEDEEDRVLRSLVEGPERRPEFCGGKAAKYGIRRLRALASQYGAGFETPDIREALSFAFHRFDALRLRARFALIRPAALVLSGRWVVGADRQATEMQRAARIRHVLIDEAQDLTPGEAELLSEFRNASYFAVLDPDQAIFGWRHAEPANLWPLLDGPASKCDRYQLPTSYRFGPEIADAATAWIDRHPPLVGAGGEPDSIGDGVDFVAPPLTREIFDDLRERHGKGGVAVLTRTNLECMGLAASSALAGISVHVTRDAFAHPGARLLGQVLALARVVVNPADNASVVQLARALDRSEGDIQRWFAKAGILPLARVVTDDPAEAAWWPTRVLTLYDPESLFDSVLAAAGTWGLWLAGALDLVRDLAKRYGLLGLTLREALEAYGERTEASGFDAAREAGLVAVATVHAAKGREWPAVVLWNAPDSPAALPAEERRVWFVARTRARSELIIVRAHHNRAGGTHGEV